MLTFYRVLTNEGEGVGGLEGWTCKEENANSLARRYCIPKENIKKMSLSMKEAAEAGVPGYLVYGHPTLVEDIGGRSGSNTYRGPRGGTYRINSKGRKSYDVP